MADLWRASSRPIRVALSGFCSQLNCAGVRAVSSDVLRAEQCELGEEVVIQVPESTLLSGTFLIYGAPLTVASLAAVLASGGGDALAVAAFGAGLIGSFAMLRVVSAYRGGVLPGIAEPRLAGRSASAAGELLAKV